MEQELVWVSSDSTGWSCCQIVQDGPQMTVKFPDGTQTTVAKDKTIAIRQPIQTVDDLTTLSDLNEAIILHVLRERFTTKDIYTYIGPMIVSINPFELLQRYGEQTIPDYRTKPRDSLIPHLYALAQNSFESAMNTNSSQAIIISGESGAGKTEAAKMILKYLTVVAEGSKNELLSAILATNPILESFGNAKTVRNNNSSRFGKLIKVNFGGQRITGAFINNYLLENTRIVYQAPGERNYHIFYQLVKGSTPQEKQKYNLLNSPEDYKYLTNGNMQVDGINDERDWEHLKEAFHTLGISEKEYDSFFQLMSGILHIGNIEFDGTEQVTIKDKAKLQLAADALAVRAQKLEEALTIKHLRSGGRSTTYVLPLSQEAAIENRDAMAKAIYSRFFDHLVKRLNEALSQAQGDNSNKKDGLFVAVLDLYGFEIFEKNSLEQLCINYANEKLHEQFNQYMFKFDQEEYSKEGIPWQSINFVDNAACIELIESKNGVLSMLDEEGQLPKGTEAQYLSKMQQKFKTSKFFAFDHKKPQNFEVKHYAGSVSYSIDGFIVKNKNTLNPGVTMVLASSDIPLIVTLFQEKEETPSGPGGRAKGTANASKVTVTQNFKKDLGVLASLLGSANRHYVRCIKPNDVKKPGIFDSQKVLQQLKNNGIMETVAIRKAGYSFKIPFEVLGQRFHVLGFGGFDTGSITSYMGSIDAQIVSNEATGIKQWAVGKSKLFLRSAAMQYLETERKKILEGKVVVLQNYIRRFNAMTTLAKAIEEKKNRSTLTLQKYVRRFNAVQKFNEYFAELKNIKSVVIQSLVRRFNSMVKLNELREKKRIEEEAKLRQQQEELRKQQEALRQQQEQERIRQQEEERKKREAAAAAAAAPAPKDTPGPPPPGDSPTPPPPGDYPAPPPPGDNPQPLIDDGLFEEISTFEKSREEIEQQKLLQQQLADISGPYEDPFATLENETKNSPTISRNDSGHLPTVLGYSQFNRKVTVATGQGQGQSFDPYSTFSTNSGSADVTPSFTPEFTAQLTNSSPMTETFNTASGGPSRRRQVAMSVRQAKPAEQNDFNAFDFSSKPTTTTTTTPTNATPISPTPARAPAPSFSTSGIATFTVLELIPLQNRIRRPVQVAVNEKGISILDPNGTELDIVNIEHIAAIRFQRSLISRNLISFDLSGFREYNIHFHCPKAEDMNNKVSKVIQALSKRKEGKFYNEDDLKVTLYSDRVEQELQQFTDMEVEFSITQNGITVSEKRTGVQRHNFDIKEIKYVLLIETKQPKVAIETRPGRIVYFATSDARQIVSVWKKSVDKVLRMSKMY
eukprot:TRINITY_DN6608_c1_g3_i1.p1 TRINITY_DN6608_c1_g3~~TRINITY_DN6608_c1_g3_i1.p1  ORF type:complete len:1306 (+),score=372.01 TRINITY_DN6608_c1_g3_i1:55-3972(+)